MCVSSCGGGSAASCASGPAPKLGAGSRLTRPERIPAAFYCVADERYFLGAVGMVNSLRRRGTTSR